MLKSNISDASHNYLKIKVYSDGSLLLEKALNVHSVIMII